MIIAIPVIGLILVSSLFTGVAAGAAETYPSKPITYIVPLEAGSDGDVLARPICQKVSALLGKPVIIVNKPGAASTIGAREVHDAKPDGYTIGMQGATLIGGKLQGLLPYDHEAFTIIGTYGTFIPIIVASTKTQRPFKTIEEVISFAKSRPGDVSIATSGIGQSWWIATMAFQHGTGTQFNVIPQPGTAAFAIAQVAGGHTDLGITALAAAKSQIEAGNIRLIAVFGSRRAPGYENIPSLKDVGYDINYESTQIAVGPPKMPKEVTQKLAEAFMKAANDPEYQKFVIERNAIPGHMPPEQALQFFNDQRKVVRAILERAGMLKEK
jgi:tripartite-type tricarboxylate transporter receptor subunit TctC